MNYVLLIIYFVLACWWIAKVRFIKNAGLSSNTVRLLFVIKVFVGFALGWISLHFYGNKPVDNDYWMINEEGWKEYQLLIHHPKEYFTNLFVSPYGHDSGFFSSIQSYWNDLKNNIIIKMVSVFNIYSRGNYYINSLFMNFIGFFGHIALFRVFCQVYKGKQTAAIIGCFLLPSCLYFSSGLHKDAVVFAALGLFCLALYQCVTQKVISARRIITLALCSILLLLIRSYVIILLLPAAAAYILSEKKKWNPPATFAAVYIVFGVLFFTVNKLIPAINPPATVVQKQQDFATGTRLSTTGVTKTAVPLEELQPTLPSFAKNALPSFNHTLLRPYLTERQSRLLLPLAAELFAYQLLFVISLFIVIKNNKRVQPFVLFGIFLSLAIYLNIGYIVDNIGSIVRYRSLYLPFLLTPILAQISWEGTKIKKNNNI